MANIKVSAATKKEKKKKKEERRKKAKAKDTFEHRVFQKFFK